MPIFQKDPRNPKNRVFLRRKSLKLAQYTNYFLVAALVGIFANVYFDR